MSFFGDMFGNFTGSQSRKDLQRGRAESESALNAGYQGALEFSNQGLTDANRITQPFLDQGQRGFGLYADSFGVNGAGARDAAFQTFQSDPFNAHSNDVTRIALYDLMKRYNAGGMANSGASNLGLARAGLEATDRRLADWRGGLQGLGQLGAGMATDNANRTYGTGQFNAGLRSGLGQQLAGNAISYNNAMSESRNTGMNNLLNVAGTVAKFFPGGGGGGSTQTVSSASGYKPTWNSYYS